MIELKNDDGDTIARVRVLQPFPTGVGAPRMVGVCLGVGAQQDTLLTKTQAAELALAILALVDEA